MTEQTFPAGGTAVAEPPAPVVPMDAADASDDGSRRKLLLVGAALGVLVLAIAAFFLLKGGGSSTPAASGSPTTTTPVATTPKAPHHKASAKKPLTLPKHFNGHVGRDPFLALYTAPAAPTAGAGGSTSTSTSTSTDGSTSTSTDGSTSTTTGGSTGSTTTTPHKAVYRPIWLQLRRFQGKNVIFDIGYSNRHTLRVLRFTVAAPKGNVGTVFAQTFSLLHVSATDVTVKYGDGTPFLLSLSQNTMIVN